MSIKYMDRVWENKELKHGRLILMLALADHANDAGECWPSQRHLQDKTRLTERQLRRLIDDLANDGYLVVMEAGKGRGKKTHYRIFPQPLKADILSETKADILSQEKRTFSTPKSGQNVQVKADISEQKADISDAIQSHARSEPPIEPTGEPSMESSSSEDEEDAASGLWDEVCGEPLPESIRSKLNALLAECGNDAVAHGIRASIEARSRNFAYIAQCARNYIPPAPQPVPSYQVDLPGVYQMPPAPQPAATPTLPAPMRHDDPWAIALGELRGSLTGVAVGYLEGSRLEAAGGVDGVPLYRVVCEERAAVGLTWLTAQAGPAIQRKLGSILGKRVQVEIVAAELEAVV